MRARQAAGPAEQTEQAGSYQSVEGPFARGPDGAEIRWVWDLCDLLTTRDLAGGFVLGL